MDPVEIIQSVQIERVCDDYILCDADSKFAFSMFYARFFLHFYLHVNMIYVFGIIIIIFGGRILISFFFFFRVELNNKMNEEVQDFSDIDVYTLY